MKSLIPLLLLPLALGACTREPLRQDDLGLPSCNLQQQRELPGELGGAITDPRQAHVSMRANVLLADVSTARKAQRISQEQATAFSERIAAVRSQTDALVGQQGFLSAAERPASTGNSTRSPRISASRASGWWVVPARPGRKVRP